MINHNVNAEELLNVIQELDDTDGWRDLGLRLAKASPETLYRLTKTIPWNEIDRLLYDRAASGGRGKIQAIKMYRDRMDTSLKEAKAAIDERCEQLGIRPLLLMERA